MEEKNEIKDAVIIDEKKSSSSKRKIDFRFELALFLILGFLLGVVIKTEASKRITIGFNDGSVPSLRQAYDFKEISEELEKKANSTQQSAQENSEENNQ
jgi:hypothetical protein